MILLDTNVLSELMKPAPDAAVVRWVEAAPSASLYTSSVAQAEILHGILLLAKGKRRDAFVGAAEAMFTHDFRGRIMPFGSDAAIAYAQIAAARSRAGRPISQFDAQIAAIARANGAPLATRNTRDFQGCGIELVNPWDA